jgi:hypothetical protein
MNGQGQRASSTAKVAAVVVPLSTRPGLTPDEEISVRHLRRHLGHYDRFLIAPPTLPVDMPDFQLKRFGPEFFGSVAAHNQLLFSPAFYESFSQYKYVLIYHLDSLVFSDQLLQWCETDLDYIGAPWLKCPEYPWVTEPKVGNGGFTLMKVQSVLKVLRSERRSEEPAAYWRRFCTDNPQKAAQLLNLPRKYLKHLHAFNSVRWETRRFTANNDGFWAERATHYYPEFKIASVEEGLRFAFEAPPRMCFELNKRQLPFGCHAWMKFDRAFWEPYLLKDN